MYDYHTVWSVKVKIKVTVPDKRRKKEKYSHNTNKAQPHVVTITTKITNKREIPTNHCGFCHIYFVKLKVWNFSITNIVIKWYWSTKNPTSRRQGPEEKGEKARNYTVDTVRAENVMCLQCWLVVSVDRGLRHANPQ